MKKIILVLASYILCFDSVFSQEIEWQNTIGGNSDDHLCSIKQTNDGGYIIGGYSMSGISGDKTEICQGFVDYWIVKTDMHGNIQWQNTIGAVFRDWIAEVEQTADGGYIVGGYSDSDSSGDKTINSYVYLLEDFWILKLDPAGNIQWQKVIGGTSTETLASIHQTTDGGYILGGYSMSGISGDKTEDTYGMEDYWIVKTDSAGNIQWQKTIGGSGWDKLNCVQQTSDGGYILGGYSFSPISGNKTENVIGGDDYWIVKTDSAGNIQWQNDIGGSSEDKLYSIKQTSDGGYILGGSSGSGISGDKTENSLGQEDYWIVKTDASGNIQWQNTIGGNYADELYSIEQASNGGYIFGGYARSNVSGDKTVPNHTYNTTDEWILKTDSAGNIIWQGSIGGNNNDIVHSIKLTDDGGFIVGGDSWSDMSGDKLENCMVGSDYWIFKLTEIYNSITGKLFIDANSNSMQDGGEPFVTNKQVTEINTGRFAFSQQNGNYNLVVLDSGNFSVSPESINYYNAVPATHPVYFSGIHQTDSLNDFAFQPTGVFNDLCITISPLGPFRAGFNATYIINYENVGTTTLNGTVIFFPDNDITFVSSNISPTSVTPDSVIWNVGTLTPFQTGNILVTVNVNAGTPIGTLINSNVRIEPVAGDNYPGCNYAYWEVYTTGSYDPNAILVDRDTVLTTELSSPPYLNYIIYFQNTGNDTAFNVRVLNNIPHRLDVNSFEFVASSHPININYGAHSRLFTFTFDNILLPDSNVNEPASHGFIRYKIKPINTLIAGNKIFNKAFIYFDFNTPVETNSAKTEIVLPTGEESFGFQVSGLWLYPNPAKDELIVNGRQLKEKGSIRIFDLFGREVYQLETRNQEPETKIDVSGFSQGVYIIEMRAGEKVLRGKFVKQ